jgi:hypothetical protein
MRAGLSLWTSLMMLLSLGCELPSRALRPLAYLGKAIKVEAHQRIYYRLGEGKHLPLFEELERLVKHCSGMIKGLEELRIPLFGAVKELLQQPSKVIAKQMVKLTLSSILKEGH